MIKIAHRQYKVNVGETITITTQSSGTVHGVNYDFDGQGGTPLAAGQALTFKIAATRVLTLLFTFTNPSDGEYVISITSDQGGPDTDQVEQGSFGVPATSTEYRFQL